MGHHNSNIYWHFFCFFFTTNSLWLMKGFWEQSYEAKIVVVGRNVIFILLLAPQINIGVMENTVYLKTMRHRIWNIVDIDMDTVASTFPKATHGSWMHVHAAQERWLFEDSRCPEDRLLKEFVSHDSSGVDPRSIAVRDHRHSVNLPPDVQTLGFWESIYWWLNLGFEIGWPG